MNILSFILCIPYIVRGVINQYFNENIFRINRNIILLRVSY